MTSTPLARFWCIFLPVTFVLNLVWEYFECRGFFVHGTLPATWSALIQSTLGDVALTLIAYALIVLATRSWDWPLRRWSWQAWSLLIASALAFSVLIELRALAQGRWSYTPSAPRLPLVGVSVIPVLQLLILFPASLGLSSRITTGSRRDAHA